MKSNIVDPSVLINNYIKKITKTEQNKKVNNKLELGQWVIVADGEHAGKRGIFIEMVDERIAKVNIGTEVEIDLLYLIGTKRKIEMKNLAIEIEKGLKGYMNARRIVPDGFHFYECQY